MIWEDEEPPADVHSECLLRLMTVDGLLMLTFTPLSGISEVVFRYIGADDLDSMNEVICSNPLFCRMILSDKSATFCER